jgi:hypothetical protein
LDPWVYLDKPQLEVFIVSIVVIVVVVVGKM